MEPRTPEELIELFGRIVVAARNVGPQTLQAIRRGGWRPKSPSAQEVVVLQHLQRLDDEAAAEVVEVVRYALDLAFHKLLTSLELGEVGCRFTMVADDEQSGTRQTLVDDAEDRDLRGAWFDWVEQHGE